MKQVCAHVLVSGIVQGVYYRYSMLKEAKNNAVSGWVRNLPDGRVEAHLQGQKEDVEAVILWAKKGPPGAQVTEVEVEWGVPDKEYNDFDVIG